MCYAYTTTQQASYVGTSLDMLENGVKHHSYN